MATRAQIRDRARIRADQDKMQFPTDAQYNLIIDSCARTIYSDLINAGWSVRPTTLTKTLNGTDVYPIGALAGSTSVHSIVSVLLLQGSTPIAELRRVDESDPVGMRTSTGGQPTHYDLYVDPLNGPYIEIFPSGATGYSVAIRYIPNFEGFTGDTSVWFGPERSDELIVLMAAAAGCRKEGEISDAKVLEDEYRVLWDRVIQSAAFFDRRNVPKIRDVESFRQRDPFDFDVGY